MKGQNLLVSRRSHSKPSPASMTALFISLLVIYLVALAEGVAAQVPTASCNLESQNALSKMVNGFSTNVFFPCYDLFRADKILEASECLVEKTIGVSAACSGDCLMGAATCVAQNCASVCGEVKATSCVDCAETNCKASLNTCTGLTVLSFEPCAGELLCGQPSWVLPVIIAGSIVGGCCLLIGCCCLRSNFRSKDYDDDSGGCCALPSCGSCCYQDAETARQREEARLMREQTERSDRIARLNAGRQAATGPGGFSFASKGGKMPVSTRVGDDFSGGTDNDMFEMSLPATSHSGFPDDLEAQTATPVLHEHAIRVSKLPTEFRKSFQVGLTPQQIFDMQTLHDMRTANEAASTLPKAVIASHKALKLMGVSEGDVQKPYSEPVQHRVERLAMVSVKQGFGVGGATAGLGPQIVDQFAVKRKAAEARAEEYHRREIEREEAKIRAEIKRENQEEKRKTLSMRASQKLTPEEAGRLSQVANARKSAKQAANRLKDFIKSTQGEGGDQV